ncbi:MAG TPA: hypothetical protein VG965_03580 [Patescibacteria group bacterium]|nr:hypothetical protein [Patescibacteria group bacterium]
MGVENVLHTVIMGGRDRIQTVTNRTAEQIEIIKNTQRFHREVSRYIRNAKPEKEYLFMTAVDGGDFWVHLDEEDIRLPRDNAYGVLDRNGRQPSHFAYLPPSETGDVLSAIHPAIPMPGVDRPIVFRADYVYDSNGNRTREAWLMRLWKPEDDEYFGPIESPNLSHEFTPFGPAINPAETIDAIQGVY